VAAIVKLIGREIPPTAADGIAPAELAYDERDRRHPRRAAPSAPPRNGHAAPGRAKPQRGTGRPPAKRPPHGAGANGTAARMPAAREPRRIDESRIVGFGDDLPAFLARPPRISADP
jgi:hypothetical protein